MCRSDRRHGLCGRAPRSASAGPRLVGARRGPVPGQDAGPALGRAPPLLPRAGRSLRRGPMRPGPGALRGCVLSRALHARRGWRLRGRGPARGPGLCLRRGRGGREAHHLSERTAGRAAPRTAALRAPALQGRNRGHPRLGRTRPDRAPGGADSRLGQRLVRDHPLPHGQAARDGHAALGDYPGPAHRGQRRAGIPRGLPRPPRDRGPDLRHRRPRRAELRRAVPALR